jgi:homoserine/homoserine lactone efflux protein
MSLDLWFSFSAASVLLLAIPGPTILLVISYAIGQGRSVAFATVPGVVLGFFLAMTVSLLGAGAVLAASATLFTIMKVVGAVYLVWLGIKLIREPVVAENKDTISVTRRSSKSMFLNTTLVTVLNPKCIVFFIAFVPQFVDASSPVFLQFIILEGTYLALSAVVVLLWVLLAGRMRDLFKKPSTLKISNWFGGGLLMGSGALTLFVQRS